MTENHSDRARFGQDDLAIIGISCEVPGARDYRQFWENIRGGIESSRFLTADELAARGVPADLATNPRYVPVEFSIDGSEYFDPDFFNIPRANAVLMDPQFRMLLQHSWKVVEDAGYRPRDIADCSVFVATSNNYYGSSIGRSVDFDDSEDYVAWMFAQGGSVPTRISYELDLRGPSMSVHTNCS
ncbi:MAG TPA: beta-ketoacyl synthase N-terminal-like domain-containing protein, partial [Mycoplana sp.]|nr:beta-ketoacyl synthase N-terminal-like domain-containing protein [Mycoplana sp.]